MRTISAILFLSILAGCGGNTVEADLQFLSDPSMKKYTGQAVTWPNTRFAVFTDTHLHSSDLGTAGKAFDEYIAADRKLLKESDEILAAGIDAINNENLDFVIVPGDLTKDGEVINHERFVSYIEKLKPGVKAFVVPGNHDVDNHDAVKYTGDTTEKVDSVTSAQFKDMYDKYGYGDAIYHDEHSLSYVAEPVEGLWLLALDSCLWRANTEGHHPHVDGQFTDATLEWIEKMLIQAADSEKAVIAFMHHGIMEHYPTNEKNYGEYVVNHADTVARLLAFYGVRTVFTGHFHAQDITMKEFPQDGTVIYDIETGSFVTWPCPYRVVSIENQQMQITSTRIEAIASMPQGFQEHARQYVYDGTVGMANDALEGYNVSEKGMEVLSPQIANAYLAHLEGDEKRPEVIFDSSGSGFMGFIVGMVRKGLIEGWWTDLPPADNELRIDLETGKVL